MADHNPTELFVRSPSGRYRPAPDYLVAAAAGAVFEKRARRGSELTTGGAARQFFLAKLHGRPAEQFVMAVLDTQLRLIAFRRVFRGTVNSCQVHPREIVRQVIELNGAAVILGHNHPSGDPTPSPDDILITRRVRDALALVDVRVLDHIVVGGSRCRSLAEAGLM